MTVKKAKKTRSKGNPDSLRRYRERVAAEKAAKEAGAGAVAGEPTVALGEEELTGALAATFLALKDVQTSQKAEQALEKIQEAFTGLDEATIAKLVDSPIVAKLLEAAIVKAGHERVPGEYIRDNDGKVIMKVPWTQQDILDRYPMVTWTPSETIPITFGGHTIQVYADEPIRTPCIFETIFRQHREATKQQGAENIKALRDNFGNDVSVAAGWGAHEESA